MVKVSFNSALAQKEAAKKEEENSQVLILPPDAKVGIGVGTEPQGPARLRGGGGSAGLGWAVRCCPVAGDPLGTILFFTCSFIFPTPVSPGGKPRAGRQGRLRSGVPRRPSPLTLLKMADRRRSFKPPLLPTFFRGGGFLRWFVVFNFFI